MTRPCVRIQAVAADVAAIGIILTCLPALLIGVVANTDAPITDADAWSAVAAVFLAGVGVGLLLSAAL